MNIQPGDQEAIESELRRSRARRLVEECFESEIIEFDDLVNTHSELMPEMAEEVEKAKRIRQLILKNEEKSEITEVVYGSNMDMEELTRTHQKNPVSDIELSGRFGDYQIIEEIGRGGMGVVYKARQISLNRLVALKMFRFSRLDSADDLRRFQNEAEAIASISHPNIVQIYDFNCIDHQPFFAMNLVEGSDLQAAIQKNPMPSKKAGEICRQIATGMLYAHQKKVLHRDLKPSNVLLESDGLVKVTDFGLAKRTESDSNLTATGQLLGTPSYMSPEQATQSVEDVDHRTDIYGIGAIMYALLTGRPPFLADNFMNTLHQVIHEQPVAPRELNPSIDRDLETVCLKCLQKDRNNRYESCLELIEDLDRYSIGEPIKARRPNLFQRVYYLSRKRPRTFLAGTAGLLFLIFLSIVGPIIAARESQLRKEISGQIIRIDQQSRELEVRNMDLELNALSSYMQTICDLAQNERLTTRYLNELPDEINRIAGIEKHLISDPFVKLERPPNIHVDGDWEIVNFAISPDQQNIVYSDAAGLLFLNNLISPKRSRVFGTANWRRDKRRSAHCLEHKTVPDQVEIATEPVRVFVDLSWIDNHTILAISAEGDIYLLNTEDESFEQTGELGVEIVCVDKSLDQKFYAADFQGGIWSFDAKGEGKRLVAKLDEKPTCMLASLKGNSLVVGTEAGNLFELNRQSGATRLIGALGFSPKTLVANATGFESNLFVTGNSSLIAEVNADLDHIAFRKIGRAYAKTIEACCLDDATNALYFLNQDRDICRLWQGDVEFVVSACLPNMRLRDLRNDLERKGVDPPAWMFERVGKLDLLRDMSGNAKLIFGGMSADVRVWPITNSGFANENRNVYHCDTKISEIRDIEFTLNHRDLIWVLAKSGTLSLFDIRKDRVIRSVQAHANQGNELNLFDPLDAVVTTGEDGAIRFWRFNNQQIEEIEDRSIIFDRPLLGVDVRPDLDLVCAVSDQSELVVWNWSTRKLVRRFPFGRAGSRPVSGKSLFSPDGKMLLAFGGRQEAILLSVPDFEIMDAKLELVLKGGVDLAWGTGEYPAVVYTDRQNLSTRNFNGNVDSRPIHFTRYLDVVRIKSTFDGNRIIGLSSDGAIQFLSANQIHDICSIDFDVPNSLTFCIDRTGDRFLIADSKGKIKCIETNRSLESRSYEFIEPEMWNSSTIHSSLNSMYFSALVAGPHNSFIFAIFEQNNFQHFDLRLALHSLANDETRIESVAIDGTRFDHMFSIEGTSMMVENGHVLATCQRRRPNESEYDGELYFLDWIPGTSLKTELVTSNSNEDSRLDNCGFRPRILGTSSGHGVEFVHFCFDGYHLLKSTRNHTGLWTTEFLGVQGEGPPHTYFGSDTNTELIVVAKRRFSGDNSTTMATFFKDGEQQTNLDFQFDGDVIPSNSQDHPVALCNGLDSQTQRICRITEKGLVELKSIPRIPNIRFESSSLYLREARSSNEESQLLMMLSENRKKIFLGQLSDRTFVLKLVFEAESGVTIQQQALFFDENDNPTILAILKEKETYSLSKISQPKHTK